jgi:hypothetical protein|nr:MAG TPA: hypothetical protein [Caudoviricetes sp.]
MIRSKARSHQAGGRETHDQIAQITKQASSVVAFLISKTAKSRHKPHKSANYVYKKPAKI